MHQRTKAHLLIDRILDLRGAISPLNLIYDTLEQSARPLLFELIRRAQSTDTAVVFVSFETATRPRGVKHFVKARATKPSTLQSQLERFCEDEQRLLIIFDSITSLLSQIESHPSFLASFAGPSISVILVYHTNTAHFETTARSYVPHAITNLEFLAVSIFNVQSTIHAKARQQARMAGKLEPHQGLEAIADGIFIGEGANAPSELVVEVEHRRRSGRSIGLAFVMLSQASGAQIPSIILRDDHEGLERSRRVEQTHDERLTGSTFSMHLTSGQKQARAGILLPYFDAQQGNSEGGRILYDMGVEDDFDEEDDEI